MATPAPAPAAAAAAPAPAATAATTTTTTPATTTATTTPAPASVAEPFPPKKKRKIQARCDADPAMKHMLDAVVGTKDKKFADGMLYTPTIEQIKALWDKLDFVKEGTLKQTHFQSVRGVDPIWSSFLDTCDVDGDGNITPAEFVSGFVFAALEKRVSYNAPPGTTTTGWVVIKSIMDLVNQHVLEEIAQVKKTMGWS